MFKRIENNIDIDSKYEYSKIIEVTVGVPEKFELRQNFPNPFNPSANMQFTIPNVACCFNSSVNTTIKFTMFLKKK